MLDGLAQHLGQNSSGILLIPAQGSDEHEVVRRMSGIPRDAVVFPLGGHVSAAVLDHLRHRRIPLAGTGYPAIDGVLQLTMERAALRTLATYLYDLGHRDVALVEMPQGASRGEGDTTPTANPEATARTEGFLDVFPDVTYPHLRAHRRHLDGRAGRRLTLSTDRCPVPEGVGNVMYVSIRTRTSIRRGGGGQGVCGGRRNA